MGISTVERNGSIECLQACRQSVGCLSLKAVSGPPKYTDEPQAIASAGCPSTGRPAHHRSLPPSLNAWLKNSRSHLSTPPPPMNMRAACPSAAVKQKIGWPGWACVAKSRTTIINGMPRHRESVMQQPNIEHGFGVCVLSTPSPALPSLTLRSRGRRPIPSLRPRLVGASELQR